MRVKSNNCPLCINKIFNDVVLTKMPYRDSDIPKPLLELYTSNGYNGMRLINFRTMCDFVSRDYVTVFNYFKTRYNCKLLRDTSLYIEGRFGVDHVRRSFERSLNY